MIPQLIILAVIVCHFSDEDLFCFKKIDIVQSFQALPSIGPGMIAWRTQFDDLQPDCSQLKDKQATHADALSSERRRKDLCHPQPSRLTKISVTVRYFPNKVKSIRRTCSVNCRLVTVLSPSLATSKNLSRSWRSLSLIRMLIALFVSVIAECAMCQHNCLWICIAWRLKSPAAWKQGHELLNCSRRLGLAGNYIVCYSLTMTTFGSCWDNNATFCCIVLCVLVLHCNEREMWD